LAIDRVRRAATTAKYLIALRELRKNLPTLNFEKYLKTTTWTFFTHGMQNTV